MRRGRLYFPPSISVSRITYPSSQSILKWTQGFPVRRHERSAWKYMSNLSWTKTRVVRKEWIHARNSSSLSSVRTPA